MRLAHIIFPILVISSAALAGNDSSFPGKGMVRPDLIEPIPDLGQLGTIPRLGLPTGVTGAVDYRRAAARLSVWPETSLRVLDAQLGTQTINVKSFEGALVNLDESLQVLPAIEASTPKP
jgi:hypothetical protein